MRLATILGASSVAFLVALGCAEEASGSGQAREPARPTDPTESGEETVAEASPEPTSAPAPVALRDFLPEDEARPEPCDAYPAEMPLYRARVEGERIELTAVRPGTEERRGRMPEGLTATIAAGPRRDANADGRDDYALTPTFDGEPECSGHGECVGTVLVSCDADRFVQVVPADYGIGGFTPSRTRHADRWYADVGAWSRAAIDGPRDATYSDYVRTAEGYTRVRGGPYGLNDRCQVAYRAGQLAYAVELCEVVLGPVGAPRDARGAAHYNLGRIAEERGDLAAAREHYEQSLAIRPGDATVQLRLDTLAH